MSAPLSMDYRPCDVDILHVLCATRGPVLDPAGTTAALSRSTGYARSTTRAALQYLRSRGNCDHIDDSSPPAYAPTALGLRRAQGDADYWRAHSTEETR